MVGLDDASLAVCGKLEALLAQVLLHQHAHVRGVDQQHLALALLRLAVRHEPQVGRDVGVVEHVRRQGHDRVQVVVLQDVAADLRFAAAGVAREQRRAVVDQADPAAAFAVDERAHLRQRVAAGTASAHQRCAAGLAQSGRRRPWRARARRRPEPASIRRRRADWRAGSRSARQGACRRPGCRRAAMSAGSWPRISMSAMQIA